MKAFGITFRNFLLFFFIVTVFNGITIDKLGLIGSLVVAVLFGLMFAAVPSLLGFFKIPVNAGSTFLLGLVLSFVFYFLLDKGLFGLGNISETKIVWGISGLKSLTIDSTSTLVVVSVVSAVLSVWLDKLSGKK